MWGNERKRDWIFDAIRLKHQSLYIPIFLPKIDTCNHGFYFYIRYSVMLLDTSLMFFLGFEAI